MRFLLLLAVAVASVACTSATAAPEKLRATVAPSPRALTTRTWTPTISLRENGKPASARLALTISSGGMRRVFRPRAGRRGSYRARVVFPSDGRWQWTLTGRGTWLARGTIVVSTRVAFELPFELVSAADGTIFFVDRGRVLALEPTTGRVRVHRTVEAQELVCLERLSDGTFFVCDFVGNRVLRIAPSGDMTAVATVAAPGDLVSDANGTTLWVASIAEGVGVQRVDVATGRVEPFAPQVRSPHGIARDGRGDFYVHDGTDVSRIDGATRAVSRFADVDAFRLLVAPDGSVYGVEGNPSGGRVVRIAQDGSVTAVVGTGSLGPHRDGPALEAQILPSSVAIAPDGALLVSQVEPVPAIRRVDPTSGRLTTLALGR